MRKSLREAVEMNFKDFELTGGRGALMAEGRECIEILFYVYNYVLIVIKKLNISFSSLPFSLFFSHCI